MVIVVVPVEIGLWDTFQMAELHGMILQVEMWNGEAQKVKKNKNLQENIQFMNL